MKELSKDITIKIYTYCEKCRITTQQLYHRKDDLHECLTCGNYLNENGEVFYLEPNFDYDLLTTNS